MIQLRIAATVYFSQSNLRQRNSFNDLS